MENKKLTAKQDLFCRHYIANGFNATQAAISAGYSEDTARSEGSRLLTNVDVVARIDELKAPIAKKTKMDAERLAQMVAECIEFDLTEWFDVTHSGHHILKCDLSELPISVKKIMVQGWKLTKFGVEVNLVSKQFLLDMQARFLSMYKDQVRVTNTYETKTDEDIENELKELEGK